MWHHFIHAICCFTVAVTASERSPAKVRIHHERSTQAELIASVEALGKTHHLKLKRTSMPSVPLHEVRQDDNGTVTIIEIFGNETRNFYEDEETGAFLFLNNENSLEGMVSESVALHYDNNEHTVTEVNEKTATPFCAVSHDKQMVNLPNHIESSRLHIESKAVSYVVEVLAVADSTLYNYKGGSYNSLVDYMRVYWKMVDRRFRTVIGASITIRLSNIIFCSSTSCDSILMEASELNYAHLYTSTMQFAKYLASYRTTIPPFDIGHLMTKRNLYLPENGNRNTAYDGIVTARGYPCYGNRTHAFNSGVSQDDGLWAGTIITAHEIGHNLGAYHDGEGTATSCSRNDGYLMSYIRNSYKTFWFSPCSSASMVNVYSQTYAGCLRTIDDPTFETYPNYIGGNYRSFLSQCQSATQVSNAIPDPTVSDNAQCYLLRCRYVIGTTIWSVSSGLPALEGTPCSTGGFCKDGYCQTSWV